MPHVEPLGPLYSQTHPAGLVRLQTHLLAKFPRARAGGMYNPTSNLSSGRPSPHRVTQAVDVMCDRDTATQIIRYLVTIAESLNLQQVIAWHEIVTVQQWARGIRYYPQSDHSDGNGHAHIHVGLGPSREWAPAWVGATPAPPKPQPTPEAVPAMLYYRGAFHYFWIDDNGDLQHRYPGATENMSAKYARPKIPAFGKLDPTCVPDFQVHPSNPDAIVGVTRAESGYLVEWIFFGTWVPTSLAPSAV